MTDLYLLIFVAAAAGLAFFLLSPEKKNDKRKKNRGKNDHDVTKIYDGATQKVGISRVRKNK